MSSAHGVAEAVPEHEIRRGFDIFPQRKGGGQVVTADAVRAVQQGIEQRQAHSLGFRAGRDGPGQPRAPPSDRS